MTKKVAVRSVMVAWPSALCARAARWSCMSSHAKNDYVNGRKLMVTEFQIAPMMLESNNDDLCRVAVDFIVDINKKQHTPNAVTTLERRAYIAAVRLLLREFDRGIAPMLEAKEKT